MRIAFIVDSFPTISESFILNQITGLKDLGHDVEIFAASRPNEREFHSDIKKYDLLNHTYYFNDIPERKITRLVQAMRLALKNFHRDPVTILNSLNIFKYGRETLALTYFYQVILFIMKGTFDIILCHFGPNGNFGALLKELGIKGKVVTMFHGYDIRRGIESEEGLYQKLFQYGDVILSISDYNYSNLIRFGADPQKIKTHPVGVDLKKYRYRGNDRPSKDTTKAKILTVTRFVEEKGMSYGIRALHTLVYERKITNVEYQMVGDGPLREELEALVADLNLQEYVHFFGYQQQEGVIELLSQADIFFLPSIAEALPVVLMEAQAIGMPVVSTDVGSVSQIVNEGVSGYIVPNKDTQTMAEKLAHLVEHPDQWRSMGDEGRKIVEEKYDIDKLNKKLINIFQDLLDHQPA